MNKCMNCGKILSSDEQGLHKKLFNRAANKFMCIDCCSKYLEVPHESLEAKIEHFKEMGCTLFASNK